MPRQHPLEKYRNIGIIAHISAGKTTTSTCILYHTGKVHKIGTLEKGTTPLDWMVQSQERAMTIMAAATTTYWKVDNESYQINIIDTPGHRLIGKWITKATKLILLILRAILILRRKFSAR